MYICPFCKKDCETVEGLHQHFQENEECRGYAKKIMYSGNLLATLVPKKKIDIFIKTGERRLIADGDRHVYTEVEI